MVCFLWFRSFVPHSVVEKDSLLLETLNNVRNGNFAEARHDLLIERSLLIKVEKEGKTEGGLVGEISWIINHSLSYSSHMAKCN